MNVYLWGYLCYDLVFTIIFIVSGLYWYRENVVILIFIGLTFFSYWPLYNYVKEFSNHEELKRKRWFLIHYPFTLFYTTFRGIILGVFIGVAIVETGQIDLSHNLAHLPVGVDVVVILLITLFLFSFILLFKVLHLHESLSVKGVADDQINVWSVTSAQPQQFIETIYQKVGDILKNNSNRPIFLIPPSHRTTNPWDIAKLISDSL